MSFFLSFELKNENNIDFGGYPLNIPVIKNLNKVEFHSKVTFFTGANGCGKSTLLEALAIKCGLNPEGGSKNFNFSSVSTHSELHNYLTLSKNAKLPKDGYFYRAETFYNVASNIDKIQSEGGNIHQYYGGKSLHSQSHGESFISLFLSRFYGNGIYILDEPEASLSPQNQLAFLVKLNELANNNSQFIIATHSPILLSYPDSLIYEIDDDQCYPVSFKDSSCYNLYKRILDYPDSFNDKLYSS